MELSSTDEWKIEMPIILDCLRKDIYSLVSRLDLPEEERVKVGKLIEQIRLEETRYEQDIRKQFEKREASANTEIAALRLECSELKKQAARVQGSEKGRDEQEACSSSTYPLHFITM